MEEQKKDNRKGFQRGSAFILAIVLTSLLAVIGVMFVMITRVDRIATSAIAENKTLDGAIETIIVKISQQLILDTPGVDGQEYYDYPDANSDPWLASLEPYVDDHGTPADPNDDTYHWGRISDVTGFLDDNSFSTQNVNVKPIGLSTYKYVNEYPEFAVDANGIFISADGVSADADGDGIADSKWIKLDGVMTTKGQPIYAAIRVIDNGGMLNVNTAYKFDPNTSDGSSQTQIDLLTLAERGSGDINDLDTARYGDEPKVMVNYIENVVWQYDTPDGNYTPFDIADELELRNRFIIKQVDTHTRIKNLWTKAFKFGVWIPYDSNYADWCDDVYYDDVNSYDYRHVSTTYNMDRIINPEGGRFVNLNTADVNSLYDAIKSGLDFNDVNEIYPAAAQIIANLIDYVDSNDSVTVIGSADVNDANLGTDVYYGFERPCVYISELAHEFEGDTNDPNRSYAVELFKPYFEDNDPCDWRLVIDNTTVPDINIPVNWSGTRRFHVIYWENPNSPMDVNFFDTNEPNDADANSIYGYDPNVYDAPIAQTIDNDSNEIIFDGGSMISLVRNVDSVDIVVDSVIVPEVNSVSGWLYEKDGIARSVQRDITLHKCIRRLWDTNSLPPTLGSTNTYKYIESQAVYIQAHPPDAWLTNIGEIGKIFSKAAYYISLSEEPNTIGYSIKTDVEAEVLINNTDPNFQQLFNYLTVMDPYNHISDPNETRVKGRININTAPWFVLAQLPWVSEREGGFKNYGLAEEIVEYRDRDTVKGFKSIGQLCNVVVAGDPNDSIDYYSRNDGDAAGDQVGFPDLTGGDGAVDDFEERDLIFARISNLVTVRSDVFTAYILVRAGLDGAQKRVIAILDRSNVYTDSIGGVIGDVKIRALHPVPDPR